MTWLHNLKARTVLAVIALGGFILTLGTLAFFPVPESNRELFSVAIGTLNILLGGIAGYYWPRDTHRPPEQS